MTELERIERAKAAMLPLVNEHMDPALRDAWLTDLATAALASSSVPEQDDERGEEIDPAVLKEMQRIRRLSEPRDGDAEDMITYAKGVVLLRRAAINTSRASTSALRDRGASQEDGR